MSKDKKYKETHKGYSRCEMCDFSPLSERGAHSPYVDEVGSRGKQDRDIRYDKKRDMHLCSLCRDALGICEREFREQDIAAGRRPAHKTDYDSRQGHNNPKGMRAIQDARREKPKVTLPGVQGVNEGPRIDLDKGEKTVDNYGTRQEASLDGDRLRMFPSEEAKHLSKETTERKQQTNVENSKKVREPSGSPSRMEGYPTLGTPKEPAVASNLEVLDPNSPLHWVWENVGETEDA